MMHAVAALAWPLPRLGEAIEILARRSGLSPRHSELPGLPQGLADDDGDLAQWVESAARCCGLETAPVAVPHAQVEQFLSYAGPAVLCLPDPEVPRFLVLLESQRHIAVLSPTHTVHHLRPDAVRRALCAALEAPHVQGVEAVLQAAGVPPRRREQARRAMLCQQLAMQHLRGCWLLRLPASAPVGRLARQARLPQRFLTLLGVQTVQYLVWLLAWWLIGRGALAGRLDVVWLLTWALLLLTLIPCRLLSTWLQGLLAIGAGGLLKQRLLAGTLNLEPDDIRHQGIGQLLGRVLESDTMETLALSGGFLSLVALIELGLATVLLGSGVGGWWHTLVLLGWLAGTGIMSWQYIRQRRLWTETRLTMTHDMVERMVGHRTRLVQEARESWHNGEDQAVERYLTQGRKMDSMMAWMLGVVPRGWLVLGLLGLLPAFSAGHASPAALAVSLGGMLLAYRALHAWCVSLVQVADAGIAWQHIAPLFHAAGRPEASGAPAWTLRPSPQRRTAGEPVLEARELVFRYRHRSEPILCGCSVRLAAGDRVLLQGPSGGGKSTLAAVLTGIRQPASGLLLLRGVDQPTLGVHRWRRHVVMAPQFHDNHVLTGTVAFNLLLGRRWPPRHEDMQEAEAVCRELGLGELLDRMPAGLLQMVGETGWQLSHGERSRLYLARALLQNADVVVLDESFAALDPENLQQALQCARERAATLLVIAHP